LYAPGLAYVAGKVRIVEGSPKSNLAPTPLVDEPSPKLVQENLLTLVYYT